MHSVVCDQAIVILTINYYYVWNVSFWSQNSHLPRNILSPSNSAYVPSCILCLVLLSAFSSVRIIIILVFIVFVPDAYAAAANGIVLYVERK